MVASMQVLQPVPLLSLGWRKATWKVGGLHARKSTRVDRSGSRAQVQQLKKVIEIDTWDRVFGGLKNHRQFLWHCPWVQIWSIMRQALELRVSFDLVSLSLSLSGHRFWRFSVIGWLRMEVSDGGEVVAVLESSGTEPNEIISDRSDEGGADGFRGV